MLPHPQSWSPKPAATNLCRDWIVMTIEDGGRHIEGVQARCADTINGVAGINRQIANPAVKNVRLGMVVKRAMRGPAIDGGCSKLATDNRLVGSSSPPSPPLSPLKRARCSVLRARG
jgi:hypothetical protein